MSHVEFLNSMTPEEQTAFFAHFAEVATTPADNSSNDSYHSARGKPAMLLEAQPFKPAPAKSTQAAESQNSVMVNAEEQAQVKIGAQLKSKLDMQLRVMQQQQDYISNL